MSLISQGWIRACEADSDGKRCGAAYFTTLPPEVFAKKPAADHCDLHTAQSFKRVGGGA